MIIPKPLLVLAVVALLSSGAMTSTVSAQQHKTAIRLPVSLEGDQFTELRARIEGYVMKVHVDIGDRVTAGQLLVSLDAPELAAEVLRKQQMVLQAEAQNQVAVSAVKTAEARLLQARSAMDEQAALEKFREAQRDRYSQLVRSGVVQQGKLDEAEYELLAVQAAQRRVEADVMAATADVAAAESEMRFSRSGVDVAKAELAYAKVKDEMCSIKAPFAGLITARNVDPGTLVTPGSIAGMSLLNVESISVLRGVMTVPAEEAQQISVGDPVAFGTFSDAENLKAPDGGRPRVSRISETLETKTRTMRVEIDLQNPLDESTGRHQLLSGQYGSATIETDAEPKK